MRQFGMIKNKNSNESEAIQLCWNSEYLLRAWNTKCGVVMNPGVIKAAADAVNAAVEQDIAEREEMALRESQSDEIKLKALA